MVLRFQYFYIRLSITFSIWTDYYWRLSIFLSVMFLLKETESLYFLDLEKACDTTWRYGLFRDLYNLRLKGDYQLLFIVLLKSALHKFVQDPLYLIFPIKNNVSRKKEFFRQLLNIKIYNIVHWLDYKTVSSLHVNNSLSATV